MLTQMNCTFQHKSFSQLNNTFHRFAFTFIARIEVYLRYIRLVSASNLSVDVRSTLWNICTEKIKHSPVVLAREIHTYSILYFYETPYKNL